MEITFYIVLLVVAFFSVVQSLFGVGLLVFGTPTFLLLGASYGEAIAYILPSSLLLSALQSHGFRNKIRIARGIILYAMPFVFIGMIFSVELGQHSHIVSIIGAVMLLLSIIRIVGIEKVSDKVNRFGRLSLILTGLVHGVSNQGGALLTLLMGSLYSDKEKIRTNIAFAYLLFGLSQFIVLVWLKSDLIGVSSVLYVLVTLFIYQFIGKSLFSAMSMRAFNLVFTGFMVVYGVLLLMPLINSWMMS